MDEKTELSDIDRDTSLDAIHATLKTLLHAHPTSASVLRNVVCDRFPHKVFLTAVQASYVKQVLHMTTYIPSLRKDVLELIIDRIVQIDVCASRTTSVEQAIGSQHFLSAPPS